MSCFNRFYYDHDVYWCDEIDHPWGDSVTEPGHFCDEYPDGLNRELPLRFVFGDRQAFLQSRNRDGSIRVEFMDGAVTLYGTATSDGPDRVVVLTSPGILHHLKAKAGADA